MCVNYFASVLLGLVPEAASNFFRQNCFNNPDCEASMKAMGKLLYKINKDWVVQGLYFNAMSLDFQNLAINQ